MSDSAITVERTINASSDAEALAGITKPTMTASRISTLSRRKTAATSAGTTAGGQPAARSKAAPTPPKTIATAIGSPT